MIYLISAIVLLGVLIAIHEFGHFIVGRMCNIHIYRFSIGMGPVIYKKLDTNNDIRNGVQDIISNIFNEKKDKTVELMNKIIENETNDNLLKNGF